jgi:hypothetical protein
VDKLVLVAKIGKLSYQLIYVSLGFEEVHLLPLLRQLLFVPPLLVGVRNLLGYLCEGVVKFFYFGADSE